MKCCLTFSFLPIALLGAMGIADQEETHIWTSTDGKYSVEAFLVDSEYDRQLKTTLFILKRKDGNLVKVPAERLSEESRQLAVRILRQRRSAARREERKTRHEAAQEEKTRRGLETSRLQQFVREAGSIIPKQTPHGSYLQYIPRRPPLGIIVVVHGTPGENEKALEVAHTFIKRWTALAQQQGAVILAPAFDQANFGGREGPGGGYRGLFGRQIGADEFVNEIVDGYQVLFPSSNGKFMLYGHSAGGQFVSRYLVRHPDRIISAVISAAGSFAFPDPGKPWAHGMGRLNRSLRWGDTEKKVNIQPDPANWLKAARLPVTVVVGALDDEQHLQGARGWVEEMNAYSQSDGATGNVRLVIVPGVGHSSSGLAQVSQRALWRK